MTSANIASVPLFLRISVSSSGNPKFPLFPAHSLHEDSPHGKNELEIKETLDFDYYVW